jgi:hypothetical protein
MFNVTSKGQEASFPMLCLELSREHSFSLNWHIIELFTSVARIYLSQIGEGDIWWQRLRFAAP